MNFKRGFTLIELLVVIAIIGLLATIITASLTTSRAKGRDAKRIADIKTIQLGLENYYYDNGMYPKNIYSTSGAAPLSGLSPNYISAMPVDPSGKATLAQCISNPTTAGCFSYQAFTGNSSPACSSANPPIKYHLGIALEQTDNSILAQDVDLPTQSYGTTGFNPCNAAGSGDFSGTSNAAAPATCSTSGTGAETCYDVTP